MDESGKLVAVIGDEVKYESDDLFLFTHNYES